MYHHSTTFCAACQRLSFASARICLKRESPRLTAFGTDSKKVLFALRDFARCKKSACNVGKSLIYFLRLWKGKLDNGIQECDHATWLGLAWLGLACKSIAVDRYPVKAFFINFIRKRKLLPKTGRIAPYLRFFVFPGKGGDWTFRH